MVFGFVRLATTMSPSGLPVTGEGLPSKVAEYSQWIFEPSVPRRSTTALTAWPAALKVTVPLFGVGPGEYLDLATLSVQVPRPGTGAWAMPTCAIAMLRTPTIVIERA